PQPPSFVRRAAEALVLRELPRFVATPLSPKGRWCPRNRGNSGGGVGLERQCDAGPGANRGTPTAAEGKRYARGHGGGSRGLVFVVARRKRHSYRAADGSRASSAQRQRDAGPRAHSRCVRAAEAATQEAQGCEQKYLQESFHAHAPFREKEPSRSRHHHRRRPRSRGRDRLPSSFLRGGDLAYMAFNLRAGGSRPIG